MQKTQGFSIGMNYFLPKSLTLNFNYSWNILINDDELYVLINNAYEWGNYQGIIGQVDLNTLNYEAEINLGDEGKNPINLMFKEVDGKYYLKYVSLICLGCQNPFWNPPSCHFPRN